MSYPMKKEVQGNSLVRAAKPNAQALKVVNSTSCDLSITAERAQREQADFQLSSPPIELIKAIAMDIGKELVDYVERMYPDAIAATSSTFRLSLRNHTYNDIMCMVKITDETRLVEWLDFRKKFRRHLKRMKKVKSMEDLDRIVKEAPINPALKW